MALVPTAEGRGQGAGTLRVPVGPACPTEQSAKIPPLLLLPNPPEQGGPERRFPSGAPIQLGTIHFSWGLLAVFLHSSSTGTDMWGSLIAQMTSEGSDTKLATVGTSRQKPEAMVVEESHVLRNLRI